MSAGDDLLPSQHNPAFLDVAQAIGNSLSRDGAGGMRAPLDMGGYKATNLAAGTNSTDAATVAQVAMGGAPVGGILDYAGAMAPAGWALCYGQPISRTTYAALFAAIGTTYGAGDGSTTFNVPDLRGRTSAGKDDMGGASAARLDSQTSTALGAAFGEQTHALTVAELAAHHHNVAAAQFLNGGVIPGGGSLYTVVQDNPQTTDTGSGTAHNNIQPTMILNKIIRTGV